MRKTLLILAALAAVALSITILRPVLRTDEASPAVSAEPPLIGFSLGTIREERWLTDRDFFIERAKQLGATVSVMMTDYNADTQIYQIDNLVSQGVKVIVVVPSDSIKIVPAIERARSAGVKVIAYDRMIRNSTLDLYVSFDNWKVGALEAESVLAAARGPRFAYIGGSPTDENSYALKDGSMAVLKPKIDSGEISLVLDVFSTDWKPDEAYKAISGYLAEGTLDAVVAANDGTAFGTIQALKEKGLAGLVPVSGQDAELSACQRVIDGTQISTVYKPIKQLAYKAAEAAVTLAAGDSPESNREIDNGFSLIPSYLIEPILVNKENMMSTVIADGFHTYEEVYNQRTVNR